MKIIFLQHFYYPDEVVSAHQYKDICEGLVKRGFTVEMWAGNRDYHDASKSYKPAIENISGVKLRRFWRPAFNQHSFVGRILNSIWLQKSWFLKLLFSPTLKPDVIITGTDPIFLVFSIPLFKVIRPKTKMVHWAFDLYPEVAIADGLVKENGIPVKLIRSFLKKAYASCDLIADLGPCMRKLLDLYPGGRRITLTPWALEEPTSLVPQDQVERKQLFGYSSLGLLYSGSFGRAHEFELTLKLARLLRGNAAFAYSARGSRLKELLKAITPEDTNIRFVEFAPSDRLSARLSAPDIHIVSLRPQWTGTVVPSKFFGALATCRPILFVGDTKSAIANWIRNYRVGWVLNDMEISHRKRIVKDDNEGDLIKIAKELMQFGSNPVEKAAMFSHCHHVYQERFSKKIVIDQWASELKSLSVEINLKK